MVVSFISTFVTIIIFKSIISKGLRVKNYVDGECIIPYGEKQDDYTENWYILEKCWADYSEIGYPTSQINVLQTDKNGTLQMANIFYSYSANCTGRSDSIFTITFGKYKKCVKNEWEQHIKVELTDEPPKRSFDQVSISQFELGECKGDVVQVDYQIMNFCIWNGDWLHPAHSKKECSQSKKQYVIKSWLKYISECLYDPDDTEVHNIGECEDGFVYDCEN